jgi:excisionase family DNA binding protein
MAEWLTPKEAADYLKVSIPTINRWCRQRGLRYYGTGGQHGRRFLRDDLDAFIRSWARVPVEPDINEGSE